VVTRQLQVERVKDQRSNHCATQPTKCLYNTVQYNTVSNLYSYTTCPGALKDYEKDSVNKK